MTQDQITHYSELMARFEGAIPAKNWQGKDGFKSQIYQHEQWSNRIQGYLDTDVYTTTELEYHTDYNWLHRVWVKFRDLKFSNEVDHLHVFFKDKIHTAIGYKSHEEAFLELGKAIEWYINLKK